MASASVQGINVKIGADTKELRDALGGVSSIIKDDLKPAADVTKSISDYFKNATLKAKDFASKAGEVATQLGKVAIEIGKFSKGALDAALEVHPETKEKFEGITKSFDDMKLALGNSLIPLIEKFSPILTKALDGVTGWIADHPEAATNIFGVTAAIGGLASMMGAAMPIIVAFNAGLLSISAPAIAVATVIGGVVTVLALLVSRMDDVSSHAAATADAIESMNTGTQFLQQNGYGDLEIWDYSYVDGKRWDEFKWNPEMNSFGAWVTEEEDLARVANQVTEAVTDQTVAMNEVTTATDITKTATEQVQEALDSMNAAVAGVTESTGTDLTEAMNEINTILESEAFQKLSKEPVAEEVASSWTTFGTAVESAAVGFSDIGDTLADGVVSGAIAAIGDTAFSAASGFDALAASINAVIGAYEDLARHTHGGSVGGSVGVGKPTDVFRASGGPVSAGNPYIVGELGPEIFVPHTAGLILPNNEFSNDGQTFIFNIDGNIYGETYLESFVENKFAQSIRRELFLA